LTLSANKNLDTAKKLTLQIPLVPPWPETRPCSHQWLPVH